MKVITYINSLLDMEKSLERKRLLHVKGNKAARGEQVKPAINIKKDDKLEFISKVVAHIKVSLKARNISVPRGTGSGSKYLPKIG